MDVKLEGLIEKIKTEGVSEAKRQAEEIISQAKRKSEEIIAKAKEEISQAEEASSRQIDKMTKNYQAAVKQSARDAVLMVRQRLIGIFDSILKKEIGKNLDVEFIKELTLRVITKWPDGSFEVLVNEKDKKNLEQLLRKELKNQAKKEITIKTASNINEGFRIATKGEDVYYDFSDAAILETLKDLLGPAIAEILDKDNG